MSVKAIVNKSHGSTPKGHTHRQMVGDTHCRMRHPPDNGS